MKLEHNKPPRILLDPHVPPDPQIAAQTPFAGLPRARHCPTIPGGWTADAHRPSFPNAAECNNLAHHTRVRINWYAVVGLLLCGAASVVSVTTIVVLIRWLTGG